MNQYDHSFRRKRVVLRFIYLLVFLTGQFCLSYGVPEKKGVGKHSAPDEAADNGITVLPPRIILYPLFSSELQEFTVQIRSNQPVSDLEIRIRFDDIEKVDADFISDKLRWKKIGNAFYLIGIYGKPAKFHLMEKFLKVHVAYRYRPGVHTTAYFEILQGKKVLKSIPVDFVPPIDWRDMFFRAVEFFRNDPKNMAGAGVLLLILLWFFYDIFIKRKKDSSIPLCSTRARFSTLLHKGETLDIRETKNPFGCRLGRLKKKIRISYKGDYITVRIGGKKHESSDKSTLSLDINKYWKLRIEAQQFYDQNQRMQKNLVILLLPV